MANLPIPSNAPDIGKCIYCGAIDDNLSKEHAVPYGLNGPWTLLRASCSHCANITHRFERDALRDLLLSIRTVLDMQTRRPENRPRNLPLVLEKNGVRRIIQVLPNEYPLYLPMPVFPAPGYLIGAPQAAGISTEMTFIHLAGPSFEDITRRYASDFAGAHLNFSPIDFARMLAKVAFTAAIYTLGLEPFTQTPIRKIILGNDPSVSHWVGTWQGEPVNEAKGLHALKIRASGSDIHVNLRLFAQFGAPEYHVILGPAAPDFARSDAWPWK